MGSLIFILLQIDVREQQEGNDLKQQGGLWIPNWNSNMNS